MTHEEHYAEAERLRALAVESYMNPEGGYDDTEPPSAEELEIRQAVADVARADAALFLAEAQVHATLALYHATLALRPPEMRFEVKPRDPELDAAIERRMREAFRAQRREFVGE